MLQLQALRATDRIPAVPVRGYREQAFLRFRIVETFLRPWHTKKNPAE
jgi:hypothetical protein